MKGELRLPLRADTTLQKGGFSDVALKLVLKGRGGLPLYSNDGARRYMRDSPKIYIIGEMELGALKIGVGAEENCITSSLLHIPMHNNIVLNTAVAPRLRRERLPPNSDHPAPPPSLPDNAVGKYLSLAAGLIGGPGEDANNTALADGGAHEGERGLCGDDFAAGGSVAEGKGVALVGCGAFPDDGPVHYTRKNVRYVVRNGFQKFHKHLSSLSR